MEMMNEVTMNGGIERAAVLLDEPGRTTCSFIFNTLHRIPGSPPGAKPSEQYATMPHLVLVTATGEADGERLKDVVGEVSSAGRGSLVPVDLKGYLVEHEGQFVVRCDARDFVRAEKVRLKDNNSAKIAGSVVSTLYTDDYASLRLYTGRGNVEVRFSRREFSDQWRMVSTGALGKGSVVDVSGPVVGAVYNDFRKERKLYVSSVAPHIVRPVKLVKSEKAALGVSMS